MTTTLSPRQSGARAVYDVLRTEIIDGTLAPDERLSEPVLAARLGVSRTPVREALRRLEAETLVVEQPTGGVRVAPLDVADARQVYEVRARLEGLLARRAAERVAGLDGRPGADESRAEDVERLSRLVDLMDTVRDHDDEVLRIGAEFHAVVERLAEDRLCAALLRQIRGHVDRYRTLATRERVGTTAHVDEHRAVARAVVDGDPDAAEDAMRAHIDQSAAMATRALARAASSDTEH
ncbi:GntR family transcriptional regulator [Luteimicrobium xylanilyticum]|uniref:HTH-type transcriptional repressor RspR n=1 Tax=Luteimicrobium xylanilyticum TaxID=1133546 RepID=A0A5P9Q6E7_9MICO|nr:GntR family transcriptional regulator [Luteimicrobium xylanilyticum]QFU96961.1 HTH-type transcriptional repressor RspR [Luteimicrobium xylanilyticum]